MGFEILSFFYSEFNIEKGAEIIFQLPKDYIKQEDFLKISEFVIPRTELCDNLVCLKLGDCYLMGYPINLKHPGYDRAKFQFNFCFIISDTVYERNSMLYEILVKKIAKTFECLEIEAQYEFIKHNRHIIIKFMERLYEDMMNRKDIINIYIDHKTMTLSQDNKHVNNLYFFYKFIDYSKATIEILPYQVPIWIKLIDQNDIKYYDISIKRVIDNIDGVTHVKKISSRIDLNIEFLSKILYNLVLSDLIAMVDIFQFANIYRATNLMKSYNKKIMFDEFIDFCKINTYTYNGEIKLKQIQDVYIDNERLEDLSEGNLFSLYCELCNSIDVNDFLKNVHHFNVNVSLLISFGLYKKIIRRVYMYCIYNKNSANKDNVDETSIELLNVFLGYLDGKHTLMEICCDTNKSLKEVNAIISKYFKGASIFYKCNIEKMSAVSLQEYIKGLTSFGISSLSELKSQMMTIKGDLLNIHSDDFKKFYLFLFNLNMDNISKTLSYEAAEFFLNELFSSQFKIVKHFLEFIQNKRKPCTLKLDQWSCFLELLKSIGDAFPNGYSVDDSWPTMFDEFYEWYCNKASIPYEKKYNPDQ